MSDKELLEEIGEMNKEDYTSAPPTGAPTTDAPVEGEEFETEAPSTEPPVETEAPSTEAPSEEFETEAPTTEAPVNSEDDEMERLRLENAELRALMEADNSTKAPSTKPASTQAPTTDTPIEDVDFLGGVDMEDVTGNKNTLNKVLNLVFKKGIEQGQTLKEGVLRSIPSVVTNVANQQIGLKESVDKFYRDNPDLATPKRKKIVALKAEKAISEDPAITLSQAFDIAEKETREILKLKKKTVVKREKGDRPSFGKKAKGKQKVKSKPKLTELQQDLNDMIAASD